MKTSLQYNHPLPFLTPSLPEHLFISPAHANEELTRARKKKSSSRLVITLLLYLTPPVRALKEEEEEVGSSVSYSFKKELNLRTECLKR